ncbi:ABC transporter ATP-binding protein [Saccharopolyspora erythraea]|uniref:ABC transporter ATP-binding protein n=1 Tax=Saccharopolyspora erythraea TaxID=1836 RepID=UPI001BAAB93B|nr:ABC transporter ATP-binding protein [Saccharopolyspora erythraea]QUH00241.1 ABC transporter ATP-binding protein [Saccharopolyspora erythraea]
MGLDVRDLSVRYGPLTAVSEVDVELADGEVLALLGPSGCGKSTLLRAVAGLERPSTGSVHWDGTDLARVPVHRRGFGMVFQDGQLFPHRDVAGNVEFGLRMRSVSRARRTARVAELLELVGLAGYERRRVTELSGGEAQRVALARALAADPRLLLLDEPLSALDRMLREQLAVDLAALLARDDATAIVVTHDHDEAFTLADRVAVMARGRILQVDTPARLWQRPAGDEVAEFLGCTTLLPAQVRDGVATCALGAVAVAEPDGEARLGLRAAGVRAERLAGGAGGGGGAAGGDGADAGGVADARGGGADAGGVGTASLSLGNGNGGHPVAVRTHRRTGTVTSTDAVVGTVRERVHRHDHVRLAVAVPEAPEVGRVEAVAGTADAPGVGEAVRLSLDPDGVAVVGP